MASLYEIVNNYLEVLENLVIDEETGEILNVNELDKATENVDEKIENVTLYIKNLTSEAKALKEEEDSLKARRQAKEKKAEKLTEYMSKYLQLLGRQKFETSKCALSFRKSKSIEITNFDIVPKEYKTEKVEITANKKLIRAAIESGEKVEGAELVENNNIQIK